MSIKSKEKEGYRAIQVTSGVCRSNKLTKAEIGHFRKARVEAGRLLLEFRIDENELEISEKLRVGLELNVDIFKESMKVDVVGRTKGKGFAGVVKRHNFHMQDSTHGNSLSHRAPGSIGQCQDPGRVFLGKKMAGHMGASFRTAQNQNIVKIDKLNNILFIKGAVPGFVGSDVIIKPSVKGNEIVSLSFEGSSQITSEELVENGSLDGKKREALDG